MKSVALIIAELQSTGRTSAVQGIPAPYGFCVVISTLKEQGIFPNIIDYNYLGNIHIDDSIDATNNYLYQDILSDELGVCLEKISKLINEDIVAFSCLSVYSLTRALVLAKYLKNKRPQIKIVFGGVGTFYLEEDLMKTFSFIDFVFIQKGEKQFCELIKTIDDESNYKNISNMVFRDGKIIKKNEQAEYNLEKQCCPDFDYYTRFPKEFIAIEYGTSEGCINQCNFCGLAKKKIMIKSISKVINDVKHLKETYGISYFRFQDDNLILKHKHSLQLLTELAKLKIKFICLVSPNVITEELVYKLADAGCFSIQYGLESASKNLLKKMNKHINLDKFREIVKLTHMLGIKAVINILAEYPGETKDDVMETIDFIVSIKDYVDRFNLNEHVLDLASPLANKISKSKIIQIGENDVRKFWYFRFLEPTKNHLIYKKFFDENNITYW